MSKSVTIKTELTMTSLELVEFINSQRGEGEPELRHRDFTAKVPKVLGEEMSEKFRASLKDSYGRDQPGYRFPKREACLMAMSYSYDLQAKVFDHMTALEGRLAQQIAAPAANPSFLTPSKEFRAAFGIARLIGLDKNVAAISANQAVAKITGMNMLKALGHQHLEAIHSW